MRQLSAPFTNEFLGEERQKEVIREIEGKTLKKRNVSATEVSKLECQGRDRQHKGSQSRKSGSAYQIEVEGSGC